MTSEQKGLRFAAGVTMVTGLALALSAVPALNIGVRLLTDLLVWPFDGAETLAAPETRLALAISGGVMAGWVLMIWQLAGEPLERAPKAVRGIIRASVLGWFVVDSAGSVAALNVLPNLVFLALFLLPLRKARAAVAA